MPSKTPEAPIETFLHPFAKCEQAISSLLAVWLSHPSPSNGQTGPGLEAFLSAIEQAIHAGGAYRAGACDHTDRETIRRLRAATDLEVVVEAYMANAGNIDIAIVSREQNTVLAIESKTRSLLGKLQLTKYRLALHDSDPYRPAAPEAEKDRDQDEPLINRRAFCTVLLRPSGPPKDADVQQDADFQKDPTGFAKSVVIGFDVLKQVRAGFGNTLTDTAFFVRETSQHIDELFENPKQPARKPTNLNHRRAQLDCLAEHLTEAGIAHGPVTNTKIPLTERGWDITLGGGATNSLMLQLGEVEFASKDARGTPEAPPTRLVDLAGGYKSVGVPSVFPSQERAWSNNDKERMKLQSAVAVRILQDVMAMKSTREPAENLAQSVITRGQTG